MGYLELETCAFSGEIKVRMEMDLKWDDCSLLKEKIGIRGNTQKLEYRYQ